MESWLTKLTNLAYETFGVVLPGLVINVFLLLWWCALGPLAPRWTASHLPVLTFQIVKSAANVIPGGRPAVAAVLLFMAWYFLGQAANWASKARPRVEGGWAKRAHRVWSFLTFRIRNPERGYNSQLEPLFEQINTRWSYHRKKGLTWREFYPLAKAVLSNSGRQSLISTYQNKYTLHRSIAAAAAGMFWLTLLSLAGAAFSVFAKAADGPNWLLLGILCGGSLILVTGFSATYEYFWTLWGDSIITESYAMVCEPRPEAPGDAE